MLAIRVVKIAMVASAATFALLVAYDNVAGYNANYEFVRHTLRMDTVYSDNVLRSRAIMSPVLWTLAYWAIILTEAVTGAALALAAWRLARAFRAPATVFNRNKQYVAIGVGLGFLLWFAGFMVVGGEWFQSWQSKTWNGQQAAFQFYMTLLGVGIFVGLPDGELDA